MTSARVIASAALATLAITACGKGDRTPHTAAATTAAAVRPSPAPTPQRVPDRFDGEARRAVAALLALDAALRARDARQVCRLTVPDYLAFSSRASREREQRACEGMFGKRGEFDGFGRDYARRVLRVRIRGPRATLRVVETNRGRRQATTVRMARVDGRWRLVFAT